MRTISLKINIIACWLIATLLALPATAQPLSFVHTSANRIMLNGDDWSDLQQDLNHPERWRGGKLQMLHLGDSHIQPDIVTDQVRSRLQDRWGNGGRGIIAALNLAHTNEPRDYVLKSSAAVTHYARIISRSWTTRMGLTGVSVSFGAPSTDLRIRVKRDRDAFGTVTLLHAPGGYETARLGDTVLVGRQLSPCATRFVLPAVTDSVVLTVPCTSDFWGCQLLNNQRGIVYNAIGGNGATYSHYLRIDSLAEQTALMHPRLIVISLGTNEAFGNLSGVTEQIDRLVTRLRRANPDAHFLLTTPMECHKRVSRRVPERVKVGRGRRARYKTVYHTRTSYTANAGCAHVRDLIIAYGRSHHIPVWDFYTIAGGAGAATHWLNASLMNPSDHIHLLDPGYRLQGHLLADALESALGFRR